MQINADLTEYQVQEGFDLLPPGWYPAEVIDSDMKQGKKGAYIKWTWKVIGKPNRIWDNMSLGNEVAMKLLKTMATCCGHRNPNYIADTEELHGKKCQIKLKIEKSEDYDDKNAIIGYKPLAGAQKSTIPAEVPPAHIAAAAMAETANGTKPRMPWEK